MEKTIQELSQELKSYIKKYEHRSFIAHWSYFSNANIRTKQSLNDLTSPVRQAMYLISLFYSNDFGGTKKFQAVGEEFQNIITLLNKIEEHYVNQIPDGSLIATDENYLDKLFISNTTFLNYYLNAPLSYFEQDIERITETFKHFEFYIQEQTGLMTKDFIDFFSLMTNLEIEIYEDHFNRKYSDQEHAMILKMRDSPASLTNAEKIQITDLAENGVLGLGISISRTKEHMASKKIDTLLVLFTMTREENQDYLYYTDTCQYLTKPILLSGPEHISFIYSKQLISAIYEYLFELCKAADPNGRKILMRRENYLEGKTQEIFRNFFGNGSKIFSNYYVNNSEKDLLILQGRYAYIIECKANKYRIPFRDPVKAYERISDDFKKSIGKGYLQAKEIENLFLADQSFEIKNNQGKIVETIDPSNYDQVFIIIVTQERFGQIQCDLSYLLPLEENDNVPWAVFIDDLETFLITLKRKKNHRYEFPAFLLEREKLYGRLFCGDELELCSYFLFARDHFLNYTNSEDLVISSPDMHQFFDDLYQVGFGFKNELNILDKHKRNAPIAQAIIKKYKLQKPVFK